MAEKQKKTPEQRLAAHKRFMFIVMLLAGAILAFVYWRYYSSFGGGLSTEQQDWGVFGDYVGGVLNPLLAFLALFALLYTIVLQVEELQKMRNEFTKTVEAAHHQTFESTFFQMLRLHHEVVSNVAVHATGTVKSLSGPDTITGRPAFRRYCEILDDYLTINILMSEDDGDADLAEQVRDGIWSNWLSFFADSHDELSHYFRQLYNVLELVDSSKVIKDEDKKQYTRILGAQLSLYELKLIFYYGLAKKSKPFKTLAERYALFEQISSVPFSKATHGGINRNHFQFYDKSAYGDWTPLEPNYEEDAWVDEFEMREEDAKFDRSDGD